VRRGRRDRAHLLRWYPPSWRERYGEEMLALLEDELGERQPGLRLRLSLLRHGLAERARQTQLPKPSPTEESALRGGALLVLVAWAAFIVGGAGFSKAAEHFDTAVPLRRHMVPQLTFDVVLVAAVLGGLFVVMGAAIAVPGFLRLVRAGRWPELRPHVVRASAVSVTTIALTIPLAVWAHTLSDHARNGGSTGYGVAFLTWVALGVASLALWTAVAAAVCRRVELSRRALRAEAALAIGLAVLMVIITAATATWWAAMAVYAPSFLSGGSSGTATSTFDLPLTFSVALMVVGVAISGFGVRRMRRA
jgi:hypothetical protein